jgi:hypothetical protein
MYRAGQFLWMTERGEMAAGHDDGIDADARVAASLFATEHGLLGP